MNDVGSPVLGSIDETALAIPLAAFPAGVLGVASSRTDTCAVPATRRMSPRAAVTPP